MADFSQTIVRWYHKKKRDLPWRHTSDPYKIWLSEVILQQTRVQQGLPYYERFVQLFPDVHLLANAPADRLMKAWQGLGYYSRARNLHHTAKYVSAELKGEFPREFEDIKKLKGVGEYTAAAIASFAFGKPHAVVDGNVFRVLARYLGISVPIDSSEGKKLFSQKANSLLDRKDPGTFNQAIMEFGALQCVPQNPDCGECPLKKSCKALQTKHVDKLPVKEKKIKVRHRYFNYFIIRKDGKLLLRKRTGNDIWQNLYELPLFESDKDLASLSAGKKKNKSLYLKHILSHQVIHARFWEEGTPLPATLKTSMSKKIKNIYIHENQIDKYPFSRLTEIFFEKTSKKSGK